MNDDKWLEVSAVARRLGVSESTAYRLIKNRILRSRRIGVSSCLRVSEKSVNAFENLRTLAEKY